MNACGYKQFVFKRLHEILVYPKIVCTDVELDPAVDIGNATFLCNRILMRDAKQLFSSHDYYFQAELFVVVQPLILDLRARAEEPFVGRFKGSHSSALPHHRTIMPE